MDTNEVDQSEVEIAGRWVYGAIAGVLVALIINHIYGDGIEELITLNLVFGLFLGSIGGYLGSFFGRNFFASSRWVTVAAIILGGICGYLAYILALITYWGFVG